LSLEDDIATKVAEIASRTSPAMHLVGWLVKRHAKDGWRYCDCTYCVTKRAASNDIGRMLSAHEIDVPVYYHRTYDRDDVYRYIREEIRKKWHVRLKALEESFLRPAIEREMSCLVDPAAFREWISGEALLTQLPQTPAVSSTTAQKQLAAVKSSVAIAKCSLPSITPSLPKCPMNLIGASSNAETLSKSSR
jgi:hypothetical protein